MRLLTGLATAAVFSASSAFAAPQNPATATFSVTITILKQCTVTAPATINLGSVGATDLIATPASSSQNFSVTCSLGTPYKVGFTGTNDLSAGSATHQMKGAATGNSSFVQYNLFDISSGATNAAALNTSTSVISDTGTGAVQTKTLKAQTTGYTVAVQPDTYTDTVTMSVSY